MKIRLLFIIFFILTSCSTLDANKIAPGYAEAFRAIKNALVGYEDNSQITPELIEQIPYASSLVRIGKGPEGLMILESKIKTKDTWVTADGVYFVMEKGKIIKTGGLHNNMSRVLLPNVFSESGLSKVQKNLSYKFYYTYDFPPLSDLEVTIKYTFKEKKLIKLFTDEKELTLIEEELSSNLINWKAINKYWVDEDYFVWKSEQYVSPRLPKIYFEITKKPST